MYPRAFSELPLFSGAQTARLSQAYSHALRVVRAVLKYKETNAEVRGGSMNKLAIENEHVGNSFYTVAIDVLSQSQKLIEKNDAKAAFNLIEDFFTVYERAEPRNDGDDTFAYNL